MSDAYLLRAQNLVKYFPSRKGLFTGTKSWVKAVDGVSLQLRERENVAIVGESGCGKTTLGRLLAGIIKPTSGSIDYEGVALGSMKQLGVAKIVQPVFQDPVGALNPAVTIETILARPFRIHHVRFDEDTLIGLLEQVGLSPGRSFLTRFPHQLSGGQRQRVVIARALALGPRLVIADEPVSGLDPTIQTQILALLLRIQRSRATAFLIISHDINLVRSMCDRTIVMYLGKVVESGPTTEVLEHPIHPYTVSLLRSFPSGNPDETDWIDSPPLLGDIPSAVDPPSGCRFRTRCPLAQDACAVKEPALVEFSHDHFAACPVILSQRGLAPEGVARLRGD